MTTKPPNPREVSVKLKRYEPVIERWQEQDVTVHEVVMAEAPTGSYVLASDVATLSTKLAESEAESARLRTVLGCDSGNNCARCKTRIYGTFISGGAPGVSYCPTCWERLEVESLKRQLSTAQRQLREARRALEKTQDILRSLEWTRDDGDEEAHCVFCMVLDGGLHTAGCQMAQAILDASLLAPTPTEPTRCEGSNESGAGLSMSSSGCRDSSAGTPTASSRSLSSEPRCTDAAPEPAPPPPTGGLPCGCVVSKTCTYHKDQRERQGHRPRVDSSYATHDGLFFRAVCEVLNELDPGWLEDEDTSNHKLVQQSIRRLAAGTRRGGGGA